MHTQNGEGFQTAEKSWNKFDSDKGILLGLKVI